MNIIVRPQGSDLCYCRPDTTWERENKDFYVPDHVGTLYWAPVVFARISKAGKCIGGKFVSRYYDAYGFGALLYCNDAPIAFSSCADHTSRLPFPLKDVDTIGDGSIYKAFRNGEEIFSAAADKELLEDTICKASQTTSLRIGDFVAVELDEIRILAGSGDSEVDFIGESEGTSLYGFKLIF